MFNSITNFEWGGLPTTTPTAGPNDVFINGSFSQAHLAGTITDVRVYSVILTDAEVDILHRAPTVDQIIGNYLY
jgi:hypothetical protein